jgi:small subunit ribosomal protein S4
MRRIRKTFKRPKKAWDLARIKDDKILLNKYGLRRKRELWKGEEILRNFRGRARELIASEDKEKEKVLLSKLSKFGMLTKGTSLDDVLALTVNDVFERRLQTVILRRGLADSIKHSRQKIVHGHVSVDGRRVIFPSYLVPVEEEKKISIIKEKGDK